MCCALLEVCLIFDISEFFLSAFAAAPQCSGSWNYLRPTSTPCISLKCIYDGHKRKCQQVPSKEWKPGNRHSRGKHGQGKANHPLDTTVHKPKARGWSSQENPWSWIFAWNFSTAFYELDFLKHSVGQTRLISKGQAANCSCQISAWLLNWFHMNTLIHDLSHLIFFYSWDKYRFIYTIRNNRNRTHVPHAWCSEIIITGKTVIYYHNQTFFFNDLSLYYFQNKSNYHVDKW